MFLICYNSKWSNDIEHSSFLFRCLHRNTFNLMINSEKNRFRCMNLFHVCRKRHIFSTDSKWFLSVCVRKSVTFNIYSPIQKICKNYYSICKWMIAEKIVFGKKRRATDRRLSVQSDVVESSMEQNSFCDGILNTSLTTY